MKNLNIYKCLAFFVLIFSNTQFVAAQDYQIVSEVPVFKDGEQLLSAWAGGLNAPQFNMGDLNNDGEDDIYIFDRSGKRNLAFIYENGNYIFKPRFGKNFPAINSWVILSDYNCDNIPDIITHGSAAPKTFKGFYENNMLKFETDKASISYLGSSGIPLNLYTVSTHKPLFKDVNGDGDKDFLSFDVSLARLYYYENLRIENNIPCDSLFFDRVDRCYGNFKETGGITLDLILEDVCDGKFLRVLDEVQERRHPGGTVIDLYKNSNDLFDLLMGDATFERINYVFNNNTNQNANYYAQDDSFPSYNEMVKISSFPAPYVLDVDKDGDEDILVAPFNMGAVENFNNVWFYENDGSTTEPFALKQKNFLVGDMIDAGEFARPTFYDENNDGLLDLVIGNGGYYLGSGNYLNSLTLYRNTGTAEKPKFTFVTDNYLDLDELDLTDLAPTFADLDGDGDLDLLCGENRGRIIVKDNNNGVFENVRFLKATDGENIDIGQFSVPTIFDLNGDGKQDLIIGTRDGNVFYYENTGNSTAEYTFRTDSLGGVTARSNQLLGYSSPSFGDFDKDGNTDLLLGGFKPGINFYSNIGNNFNADFNLTSSNFFEEGSTSEGSQQGVPTRLQVAAADISNDGFPEVLVGWSNGGILFYSQDQGIVDTSINIPIQIVNDAIQLYPNPTRDFLRLQIGEVFKAEEGFQVQVIDVLGKVHFQSVIQNRQQQIDVQSLPKGMYLLQVQQGHLIGSLKWVKL